MSAGKLLYAEYAGNVVTAWDGNANTKIWNQDGCGPSAVVPMGENFGITCYDSGQLVVISSDGKTLKSYDKDASGASLLGPNDGTPDGIGGAYFTLSGPWESGPIVGRVVHLAADGTLTEVANDLHYANGITKGADGRLYVNESEAGRVISFTVVPMALFPTGVFSSASIKWGNHRTFIPMALSSGQTETFTWGNTARAQFSK